jgi:pilus assembly protein CpaB
MRVVIIGLIFTAVILAGGTAYMLRSYLSSQEAEFASKIPKAPTSSVMVAAVDMPTGTPLNAKNIEWQPWPEDAIQDGFLVKTHDNDPLTMITKDKHVSRHAFTKGEPIIMSKLYKSDDPGFLRGSLTPGMRAVAVKSNAETSASGFILPGDRVDIMLTHSMVRRAMERQASSDGSSIMALEHTSETIMENLRVLAVDQKVSEFEGGAVVAKNVLLEVTPKQAEKLNTAKSMGKLSLILRSAEEGTPRDGPLYTTDVEVSPILSAIGGVSYEGGAYSNGDLPPLDDPERSDDDIYTPTKRVAKTPAASPPSQQTGFTSKAPSSKRQITIYRGPGAAGDGASTDIGDETSADGELVE